MINTDFWINADGVLKKATLKALAAKVSRQAVIVLDGWCATNPKQMKAWEKDGSLPQKAQELDQEIQEVLEEYRKNSKPGDPALANHEIYELYGKPQLVL
jgi:hypothetical protein